jgi:hypothetical protein
MPAHLTPAEARRLGIGPPDADAVTGTRRSRGGARRVPASPAECFDCGQRCDGETAQTRHLADTGHRRYQLLLDLGLSD